MLKLPPNFLEGSQTRPSRNVDPKVDLQTNQAKKKSTVRLCFATCRRCFALRGKKHVAFRHTRLLNGCLDLNFCTQFWAYFGRHSFEEGERFVQGYVSRANFLRGKRGVGLTSELKRRSLHFKRVYFEDFAGGKKWTPLVDPSWRTVVAASTALCSYANFWRGFRDKKQQEADLRERV